MAGPLPVAEIGAIIGAGIGFTNGLVISNLVAAKLRKLDRSETDAERADFEKRVTAFRWITLAVLVSGTTGLGYMLGRIIG